MEIIRIDKQRIAEETERINKLINYLNNCDSTFTNKEIKELLYDIQKFTTKVYQDKLKELSEEFCFDYDKAKLMFDGGKFEVFKNIAAKKTEQKRNDAVNLYSLAHFKHKSIIDKCLRNDNGKYIAVNTQFITDINTYKTANEKQEKVVRLLKEIQPVRGKLEQMGIFINSGYFRDDNEINENEIYKL